MPVKQALPLLLALCLGCVDFGDPLYEAAFSGASGEATFEAVQQIFLEGGCLACHTGAQPQGDLSLEPEDVEEALFGPDGQGAPSSHPDCEGAPMVTSGAPDDSCLYILVVEGKMPPVGELPEPQVQVIHDWIAAGAPLE